MNKVLSIIGCLLLMFSVNTDIYAKGKKAMVICNFESMGEVKGIFNLHNIKAEIVKENVTEGKGALKVLAAAENTVFPFSKITAFGPLSKEEKDAFTSKEWEGEYTQKSVFGKMSGDWSPYETLKIDVYNPNDDILRMGMGVLDDKSGAEYLGRYGGLITLKPGANKVEVDISGLCSADQRGFDMKKIKCLWLSVELPEGNSLYLDNLRLEAGE